MVLTIHGSILSLSVILEKTPEGADFSLAVSKTQMHVCDTSVGTAVWSRIVQLRDDMLGAYGYVDEGVISLLHEKIVEAVSDVNLILHSSIKSGQARGFTPELTTSHEARSTMDEHMAVAYGYDGTMRFNCALVTMTSPSETLH